MTLTGKKINETVSEMVGEDTLPVVKYLKGRKNISEFKIAEKTGLEVNSTRSILYRLHKRNLVNYHRKKDRIKGWYISYWTFNIKGLKHSMTMDEKLRLERLKERLAKEEMNQNSFYICPNICARLDFDKATEFEFKCPECGNILNLQDNTKTIDRLKEQIAEIEAKMKKKAKSAPEKKEKEKKKKPKTKPKKKAKKKKK